MSRFLRLWRNPAVAGKQNKPITKAVSFFVAVSFLTQAIFPSLSFAQELLLPKPNQFVPLSSAYSFPVLKGMKFDPADPLKMEFIIDTANQKELDKEEVSRLVRYFLAGLTIPEQDLWVNMSPYEKDRIIPERLAETDLGKDLLSQDYILKQLSSSLTYPESEVGKDFWMRTYEAVLKIAQTTKVPVNTFNKIWITPDEAEVYENGNFAFITKATLKAMLEEDYLALKTNISNIQQKKKNMKEEVIERINQASSQVVRQVILPKITQEINQGKNFSALRQIYYSLILGVWFKKRFQDSIYEHYIEKNKTKGIDIEDKEAKEKIYNLYLEAFKKGLYNYIKSEKEPSTGKRIKRQYFSGGTDYRDISFKIKIGASSVNTVTIASNALRTAEIGLTGVPKDLFSPRGTAKVGEAASPIVNLWSLADLPDGLKRGFFKLDFNMKVETIEGKQVVTERTKLLQKLSVIEEAFEKFDWLSTAFHLGRPQAGVYNLKQNVDPVIEVIKEEFAKRDALKDIVVIKITYEEIDKAFREYKKVVESKDIEEIEKIKESFREFFDEKVKKIPNKKIFFVFENIRFFEGEKSKDANLRKRFAEFLKDFTSAQAYINAAFESCHNEKDASMEMVELFTYRAADLSITEEVFKIAQFEERATHHPFFYIFGGIKFDKLKYIAKLLENGRFKRDASSKLTDVIALVGGLGIVYNYYALGFDMGKFKEIVDKAIKRGDVTEEDLEKWCKEIKSKQEESGFKLIVPIDHRLADTRVVGKEDLKEKDSAIDIGPETIKELNATWESIKKVIGSYSYPWISGIVVNGGAGKFDDDKVDGKEGTIAMLEIVKDAQEMSFPKVPIFSIGNDMQTAFKHLEYGELLDKIIWTTGGGVVLAGLAKGITNLGPIKALITTSSPLAVTGMAARKTYDSRGNETIEFEVNLKEGERTFIGSARVPAGASIGDREVWINPDFVKTANEIVIPALYKAIKAKEVDIASQKSLADWLTKLDSTVRLEKLGGNVVLAVCWAFAQAVAELKGMPLYQYWQEEYGRGSKPYSPEATYNILNAGAHGSATTKVDTQETQFVLLNNLNAAQQNTLAAEVNSAMKRLLKTRSLVTTQGDEGGYSPEAKSNMEYVHYLLEAISSIKDGSVVLGRDIAIAFDFASTGFFKDGFYYLQGEPEPIDLLKDLGQAGQSYFRKLVNKGVLGSIIIGKKVIGVQHNDKWLPDVQGIKLSRREWLAYVQYMILRVPVWSVEDVCAENDWESIREMTRLLEEDGDFFEARRLEHKTTGFYNKKRVWHLGDDSITSNPDFVILALEGSENTNYFTRIDNETIRVKRNGVSINLKKLGATLRDDKYIVEPYTLNAFLLKFNQIGTPDATFHAAEEALNRGALVSFSHRSGSARDWHFIHGAYVATSLEHRVSSNSNLLVGLKDVLPRVNIKAGNLARERVLAYHTTREKTERLLGLIKEKIIKPQDVLAMTEDRPVSSSAVVKKVEKFSDILEDAYDKVKEKFEKADGDEFVLPVVAVDENGKPIGRIQEGDTVFCLNFRTDRLRQLIYYFTGQNYEDRAGEMDRSEAPNVDIITMTQYDAAFPFTVVLKTSPLTNTYGEALANYVIRQIRRAETAKIKHVTYFFNGEKAEKAKGEEHGLIHSQEVATYNLAHEMRAKELADAVIGDMSSGKYEDIILNFANADMLGHTGDFEAAKKGVKVVDTQLGRVVEEAQKQGFLVVVTSDHGNAEQMMNEDGSLNTAHTTNPVPFIIIGLKERVNFKQEGNLTNIAPTLFHLRGYKKPLEMDQESLITTSLQNKYGKILTIILDGWGIREEKKGNAIAQAHTPNMDNYLKVYPNMLLKSSDVPSSERGHTEIGAGRKLKSPREQINEMIEDGSFFNNDTLKKAMLAAKNKGNNFHIIGLVSDGDVHSSMKHWYASLDLAKQTGLQGDDVVIHAFLDGRDTPPKSAQEYLNSLSQKCKELGVGVVVDIMGRYWAMDRENKWDRIKVATDALIGGKAEQYVHITASSALRKVANTDPLIISGKGGIDLQQIKVNPALGSVSSPVSIPKIDFSNFQGFSFQIIKLEEIEPNNILSYFSPPAETVSKPIGAIGSSPIQ